jgi:hypothetical protein
VSRFQHHTKLCSKYSTLRVFSLNSSTNAGEKNLLVECCFLHGKPAFNFTRITHQNVSHRAQPWSNSIVLFNHRTHGTCPVTTFPPNASNISTTREGSCACRKWLLFRRRQARGQLSALQYTTHTLNSDSTKHSFLLYKIAGEEMTSKILQRAAGPFCTTSEFKACDPPPVVY